MFKSLKVQLLFFFLITNIIILLIFSIFIYNTAQQGVSNTLDNTLRIISLDTVTDFQESKYLDANEIASELTQEFSITPLYINILYYNKKNKQIQHQSTSSKVYEDLFQIPFNVMGYLHSIYYFNRKDYRVSSMLVFEDNDSKIFLQLATKKIVDSVYLDTLATDLLIANPIILILFLLIANILINRTLRPMKDVVKSVNTLSANKLSSRINSENIPTEVKNLVETFNNLLSNLEDSFNRVSAFSSDASHELKTPLTVIRGDIEVTLRQDRTEQEYKNILKELLQETIYMQETIEQLFFITKKDSPAYVNNKQELYLDEILTDVIKQITPFSSNKSIGIEVTNIIPVTIYANETLIKIAINNIIRNAILYSQASSKILIDLKQQDGYYLLKIQDSGIGIAKEDLVLIFERFYRVDKVRSRKESGTGLGLSIVKTIVNIHNYSIEIKSELGEGTTVLIKIPY